MEAATFSVLTTVVTTSIIESMAGRGTASVAEAAFLNLVRTSEVLMEEFAAVLKPYGISATQYNVLRILRGAGEPGLICSEIGSRMLTKDPDITRLLDRLEARQFVSRTRDTRDRRVIVARIQPEGLSILSVLEKPVSEFHLNTLGKLGQQKLAALVSLLEMARERA